MTDLNKAIEKNQQRLELIKTEVSQQAVKIEDIEARLKKAELVKLSGLKEDIQHLQGKVDSLQRIKVEFPKDEKKKVNVIEILLFVYVIASLIKMFWG